MKSSPEKDFWNAIRNRLENYKEEPQDDWLKIAGAIPAAGQGRGNKPVNAGADLLSLISVAILVWTMFAVSPEAHTAVSANLPTAATGEMNSLQEKAQKKQNTSDTASLQQVAQRRNNDEECHHHGDEDQREGSGNAHDQDQRNSTGEQHLPLLAYGNDSPPDVDEVHFAHVNGTDDKPQDEQVPYDSLQRDVIVKSDTVVFAVPPVLQQKSKPRRKFKPSVYAVITPSFAYQKIVPLRDDNITIQRLNSEGLVSADRLGWSLEAGFQMQVSNALELYAAISYYEQHRVVSYSYVTDGTIDSVTDAPKDWSYELTPDEETRAFRYAMRNGGAAAGVLYHIRGRKLMHKLGAGLQYQKGLISASGEYSYNNASSSYLNYQLLYRMEYSVGRRTSVFLQPQFVRSIVADEVLHEPFEVKPYRAGLGFGLLYHFD